MDKINVDDKSTAATIAALDQWRGEILAKDFIPFVHLRSDAGSNFTSNDFRAWCADNHIKLSIAGPKHQEQNGFAEASYRILGKMARSMLVSAHLPLSFYHLAIDYACIILRVLPHKGLKDADGNPTTTYQVLHNKKPRLRRFKVFGCPVIFKRYKPQHDGDTTTRFKQLQRGSHGIFVGFPRNQAGWLIYVPEKIGGHHLIVSMDVVFDQSFLSSPIGTSIPFAGAQPHKSIGPLRGVQGTITETTGDITNITDTSVSHWGTTTTFDIPHSVQQPNTNHFAPLANNDNDSDNSSSSSSSSSSSPEHIDNDSVEPPTGLHIIDGLRRSSRVRHQTNRLSPHLDSRQTYGDGSISSALESSDLACEFVATTMAENESIFSTLESAADVNDVPITPYLPEPKTLKDIKSLPPNIRDDWLKATKKEIKFLIENDTFQPDEQIQLGDEVIPAMIIYKAKVTSRGYLDKLKARCVARGDLEIKSVDPDDLWSPCVFARTFKMFVAQAVKLGHAIKQLDYIGAFCQGIMQKRLFIQLPTEYAELVPEYADYFSRPQLIRKSIYGTLVAAKIWNHDLTQWLLHNDIIPFHQSDIDPSLFIHRRGSRYLFMIIYVDDSLYFGSDQEIESLFETSLGGRFKIDVLGWSHWFLGSRLYRDTDGSYYIDQENYIRHLLNRYCGKDAAWGLPEMQDTPAPVNYVYSKDNRPKTPQEKAAIQRKFPNLSMPSAVSSLLYAALNTRCDILWITNKLAKSASNPGMKDFEALLHVFGYLRKYADYGIKFYSSVQDSPAFQICTKHKVSTTRLIGFTDSSWQDCPDTGRSTCGYKIFVQGGLVDAQSTMPIPIALSTPEAEYMGACNLGAMLCHLRDLEYDFEFLGTTNYDINGSTQDVPSIILVDNEATIRMGKNYRITKKNRHIRRRWHFVRYGVQEKLFTMHWIPGDDQLADDCTKTQVASKSQPSFDRTLVKIPAKIKGYKSTTIGNR